MAEPQDVERAARLWCLPQHSAKEMDVAFAQSIAAEFAAVREEAVRATVDASKPLLTWHRCRGEKVRHYPALLCSNCIPGDPRYPPSVDFDPVEDAYRRGFERARAAAWDAARAAAGKRLAPTVASLQLSAQDLVRRMCAVR